jgi:hypothetical protein
MQALGSSHRNDVFYVIRGKSSASDERYLYTEDCLNGEDLVTTQLEQIEEENEKERFLAHS